jgi:hypothetical protein
MPQENSAADVIMDTSVVYTDGVTLAITTGQAEEN